MFGSVLSAAGLIQGIISLAMLLFLLVSMLRSNGVTKEESERADMRSLSWPAAR